MQKLSRQFWFAPLLILAGLWLLWLFVPLMLGVKPVMLWTDRLIVLLLAAVVLLVAYIRRKAPLREAWLQVFRQRRAMIALVVLCAFIVIGLLDSIHYRKPLPRSSGDAVQYSVEVLSVLDAVLERLRAREEKTYSAPFATHLYAKETVTLPDGRQVRIYPRLTHAGRHLADPQKDKAADIMRTSLQGVAGGVLLGLSLLLLLTRWLAWRKRQAFLSCWREIWRGASEIPWRSIFLTILIVIVSISTAWALSGKYHVFGTDKVGQDVLYLSLKSIRTGLVIGTLTTLVMLPFAIALGIMAGYFRGWVDDIIQYLYTTLSSIPGVLLIAAAILSIQVYIANHPSLFETATDRADLRLLALCVILGITSWTGLCRLLRGETLKLREMDYIQAATALGVRHFTILGRHVMPNVLHIVLIMVVLDFSGLVLAEAVLSYVGVGVDPSTISWGNMINGARLELAREPVVWWSLIAAFCLMFTLVLAANLFADAVRDAFDPRLREQA